MIYMIIVIVAAIVLILTNVSMRKRINNIGNYYRERNDEERITITAIVSEFKVEDKKQWAVLTYEYNGETFNVIEMKSDLESNVAIGDLYTFEIYKKDGLKYVPPEEWWGLGARLQIFNLVILLMVVFGLIRYLT